MGALSIWHWLIVLAVVLLLFGSKKLPDAARGLGRSMRIFKSEIKEMQTESKPETPNQIASERADGPTGGAATQAATDPSSDKRPA